MILLMLVGQMETVEPSRKEEFSDLTQWCVDEVSKHAVRRREGLVVLESVGENGEELSGCAGRLMNPGQCALPNFFFH